MEVIAPLARSPEFRLNTTPFSPRQKTPFPNSYHYPSAPTSPARSLPLSPKPIPVTRRPLQERGRSPLAPTPPHKTHRKSRSYSPTRNDEFFAKNSSRSAKGSSGRKWPKLKDLLLFRSASEGSVSGKDGLPKYAVLAPDAPANKAVVRKRKQPAISPHEKHYVVNRAAAEENKRKTRLPYQRCGVISFIGMNKMVGRAF